MTTGVAKPTTDTDPVRSARRLLCSAGAFLMPANDVRKVVGAEKRDLRCFAAHWDDLVPDSYAAELGTRRLRRYGSFSFTSHDGLTAPLPHDVFVQPEDSNPLYAGIDRYFEPLTDAFLADPLLHRMLALLGETATALDTDADVWRIHVTPFRVLATGRDAGQPAPEGLHRDGVTLVTSLLVDRRNAAGGESSVCDLDGRGLVTTTLSEPGTLLLGDDRRTLHGVSPIRPVDPAQPARRDVLVITFVPR
ncbi:MAG: 2OG-Fe dioxygenase family protein [Rhodococcus sp. (in: high G+C Gram-positive bacteria)]|uniref:2OG-Fe dioxygenase family protein n=1 Tax=Rhodococcus sp. TaxID=1831 RepID=UPI003BAF8E83